MGDQVVQRERSSAWPRIWGCSRCREGDRNLQLRFTTADI
jgi:hypothetical protein